MDTVDEFQKSHCRAISSDAHEGVAAFQSLNNTNYDRNLFVGAQIIERVIKP